MLDRDEKLNNQQPKLQPDDDRSNESDRLSNKWYVEEALEKCLLEELEEQLLGIDCLKAHFYFYFLTFLTMAETTKALLFHNAATLHNVNICMNFL